MSGLCGYLRGLPGQGASNDGDVIKNMDFQGFQTLRLRHLRKWGQHYYIPVVLFIPLLPFHRPQNTWPWVTLNGHFTLNFHYYELPLSNYLLLIYCRVCLHMWLAKKCGKRSSGPWSAEYLVTVISCRCYIVKTLTNKGPTLLYNQLLSALSPFHRLQNMWLWMTLNRHFALNSVLHRYIWSCY